MLPCAAGGCFALDDRRLRHADAGPGQQREGQVFVDGDLERAGRVDHGRPGGLKLRQRIHAEDHLLETL